MRRVILIVIVAAIVTFAGCSGAGSGDGTGLSGGGDGADAGGDGAGMGGDGDGAKPASGDSEKVGVSAGGAQDANAFRKNIREGYVPQPTDLTYEGLFHDYYFDTGQSEPCEETFCPSYTAAVTTDPLSNETERFVTVGLNSGLTQADVDNQPLNLVVVVDTSGSMSDEFDEYYYDGGEKHEVEENQRKMEAARESVVSMIDRLDGEDRVSIVEYDSGARVVHDLRRVDETDRGELRSSVRSLSAGGSTSLDAGMRTAHDQVAEHADDSERETRVIYVTDAMPNTGDTGGESLKDRMQRYANEGIHTTFVGVGVDFNSALTEQIATVKGANYYSVHSPAAFDERMDEGFSYMVSPIVHNLSLRVEGEGYEIDAVYGSPQADESGAELLHVTTLFPSRREGNKSEGGIVLLELDRVGADPRLEVTASYEETDGTGREMTRNLSLEDREPPYYGSTGIRKAVALSEYANLMRNWMAHERTLDGDGEFESPERHESVEHRELDSRWEQRSVDLSMSAPYDDRVDRFVGYFESEMDALGADRMQQDLQILQRLVEEADDATSESADEGATDPEDTAVPSDDGGPGPTDEKVTTTPTVDDESASIAGLGFLGSNLSTVGLVNLVVTLVVAGYSIRQKRLTRDHDDL